MFLDQALSFWGVSFLIFMGINTLFFDGKLGSDIINPEYASNIFVFSQTLLFNSILIPMIGRFETERKVFKNLRVKEWVFEAILSTIIIGLATIVFINIVSFFTFKSILSENVQYHAAAKDSKALSK
jgi:hypothetical protein